MQLLDAMVDSHQCLSDGAARTLMMRVHCAMYRPAIANGDCPEARHSARSRGLRCAPLGHVLQDARRWG
jgi:hypothetical protein